MFKITLKMARLNKRMSLKDAAQIAGVTPKTMKKWEEDGGKTPLYPTLKLLDAYGISMDHVTFKKEKEVIEELQRSLREA